MAMALDIEDRLTHMATMVEPAGVEIRPEAIAIGTTLLREVDTKYGPDSDHPLSFHNASHGLDMTERLILVLNLLWPFMEDRYREDIYDLAMVGGPGHDWRQLLKTPGLNEQYSSKRTIKEVEAHGGPLNTDRFKRRLDLGIMATAVQFLPTGEIVQARLQSGEADQFKFAMAFGDINGIAMEGPARMVQDATNHYYEITDEPTVDGWFKFLIGQEGFLSERLNDRRIKADIAYHFPDSIEEVYAAMYGAFHKNIVAAHGLAVLLGKRPELKVPVAAAVRSLGALDRTVLGDMIGRTIQHHAGHASR